MTNLAEKIKGRIAVLYGGESSEREVSLTSGRYVLESLTRQGIDVVGIDVKNDLLAETLKKEQVGHCFNILHGGFGENGCVQAVLESLNISYTGSGVLACALAMDKFRTKLLWAGAGIPTADFKIVTPETPWSEVCAELGAKVMIKPATEGSSIGMAVATCEESFMQALASASGYGCDILAEKWLSGSEYTVAIVGENALPVIQLKTDHEFYDYDAKYLSEDTQYIYPSDLGAEKETEMQCLAKRAFDLLGCEGWGRIDVMTDEAGDFYLLEANTVPGMTDHSLVPMAAKAAEKDFDELVAEILALSL